MCGGPVRNTWQQIAALEQLGALGQQGLLGGTAAAQGLQNQIGRMYEYYPTVVRNTYPYPMYTYDQPPVEVKKEEPQKDGPLSIISKLQLAAPDVKGEKIIHKEEILACLDLGK
jgi:hypothetical protein